MRAPSLGHGRQISGCNLNLNSGGYSVSWPARSIEPKKSQLSKPHGRPACSFFLCSTCVQFYFNLARATNWSSSLSPTHLISYAVIGTVKLGFEPRLALSCALSPAVHHRSQVGPLERNLEAANWIAVAEHEAGSQSNGQSKGEEKRESSAARRPILSLAVRQCWPDRATINIIFIHHQNQSII